MGARANYVVVENGAWTLHYSHWGAGRLATDLAHGPAAATRCFRANSPVPQDEQRIADSWLNDVWCEGAALVDHDRRQLLWFTDPGEGWAEYTARREVLARMWPGWEVRWAHDGLGDLQARLGLGRDFTRTPGTAESDSWAPLWVEPEDDDDVTVLVTVRQPDGSVRARGGCLDPFLQLIGGQGLLGLLPADSPEPALAAMPDGGIHLDPESRTIGLWTTRVAFGLYHRPLRGWDGWTLEFWGDDHTRQAEQAGDRVRFPRTDLGPALADWLRRIGAPPRDPGALLRQVAALPSEDDRTVLVNPLATVRHTAVEPTAEEVDALRAVIAGLLAEQ
ncbi:hypothetical protein ACEZCY_00090 [Streptacidiphilus sp. N1-12]|uniref:Uncharacterized protein n=2 Tax=Streptacidiphilus alkalitolerans TaxID=3342712 RepID=A0ABV6V1X8_9ACTN